MPGYAGPGAMKEANRRTKVIVLGERLLDRE
jgi:hypothetical protein